MKLKLFSKLFGAFLLTEIVIVGLLVGTIQFYASQNFTNYVSKMEIDRQQTVVKALESYYQQHQSWDQLQGNFRIWRQLLSGTLFSEQSNNPQAPLFRSGRGQGMMGQMREMGSGAHMMMGQRWALFDQNKKLVVGNTSSSVDHVLRAIMVDGKLQGWLGLKKIEHISNPIDIEFLTQQSRIFYLLGFGIFLLATLIAWFVSRQITAPIQQLTQGAQALASREFGTRIRVNTADELGVLADNFNATAQTLENYEQMQKQWMSDFSHELGTPLSILRGEIEAMQDGIRPMHLGNLDSLHFEVLHLEKIVKDCKELTLAETRGMLIDKKSLMLFQVLKETLRIFYARFEDHDIAIETKLDLESKITILGDEQRLVQLFSNLLENVIRYADTPGVLKIWETHTNSQVSLHFEDSGPGVPEAALSHLFDRFYRLEQSRNRNQGGSGLGLAICKHIVDAHNGKIEATNAPEGGLDVEIIFPLT